MLPFSMSLLVKLLIGAVRLIAELPVWIGSTSEPYM
jgi:hypothetical protein